MTKSYLTNNGLRKSEIFSLLFSSRISVYYHEIDCQVWHWHGTYFKNMVIGFMHDLDMKKLLQHIQRISCFLIIFLQPPYYFDGGTVEGEGLPTTQLYVTFTNWISFGCYALLL